MISDEELAGLGLIKSERIYVSADLLKGMATEIMQFRQEKRGAEYPASGEDDPCLIRHVWVRDESMRPHPYVCKVCGENMDEDCFGDDL
jgi:hypothetical protein